MGSWDAVDAVDAAMRTWGRRTSLTLNRPFVGDGGGGGLDGWMDGWMDATGAPGACDYTRRILLLCVQQQQHDDGRRSMMVVIHARCGGDVASKASAGRTRRAMSSRCARATSRASASAARGHSGNVHTAWMMYATEYIANAMMA